MRRHELAAQPPRDRIVLHIRFAPRRLAICVAARGYYFSSGDGCQSDTYSADFAHRALRERASGAGFGARHGRSCHVLGGTELPDRHRPPVDAIARLDDSVKEAERDKRMLARPDRRQVVLGGMLLTAGAGAAILRAQQRSNRGADISLNRVVPRQIGPYRFASATGLIVPSREETSTPIYDDVLTRVYVADKLLPLMLLIAYGSAQNADLALHRPEACYPSAGYQLGRASLLSLAGVPGEMASALTATRSGHDEQLYYWSRIGRSFPATRFQEKWAVLRANLWNEKPDGVLVRLSIRSPDREAAMKQMMAFNHMLLTAMSPAAVR